MREARESSVHYHSRKSTRLFLSYPCHLHFDRRASIGPLLALFNGLQSHQLLPSHSLPFTCTQSESNRSPSNRSLHTALRHTRLTEISQIISAPTQGHHRSENLVKYQTRVLDSPESRLLHAKVEKYSLRYALTLNNSFSTVLEPTTAFHVPSHCPLFQLPCTLSLRTLSSTESLPAQVYKSAVCSLRWYANLYLVSSSSFFFTKTACKFIYSYLNSLDLTTPCHYR